MNANILVVEDVRTLLEPLKKTLEDCNLYSAKTGLQAVKLVENGEQYDVIVSDLRISGIDGLELLDFVRRQDYYSEMILLTAHGTVESAVKAMKMGAFDYIEKPVNPLELRETVRNAVVAAKRKNDPVFFGLRSPSTSLICESSVMKHVNSQIEKAANSYNLNVLISGETGTGKEFIARAIHDRSIQRYKSFVPLKCYSLSPEALNFDKLRIANEALDSEEGSKYGLLDKMNFGTLFLDNVSLLSPEAQISLAGFLDKIAEYPFETIKSHEASCRIIAATNEDLLESSESGKFSKELFFRLNVLPIRIPSLRERVDDIEKLAYTFLDHSGMRSKIERISDDAFALLKSYDWPGNVRELRNCIESAASFSESREITAKDLPLTKNICVSAKFDETDFFERSDLTYHQAMELGREYTAQRYLSQLIKSTLGNVSKAAKIAGIERASLHRVLKRYGIDPNQERISR